MKTKLQIIFASLLVASLAACTDDDTNDNADTGGTDVGETDTGGGGEGTGDGDTDTGNGEGDTDTGTGDGDTDTGNGEGDTDTGTGDGDTDTGNGGGDTEDGDTDTGDGDTEDGDTDTGDTEDGDTTEGETGDLAIWGTWESTDGSEFLRFTDTTVDIRWYGPAFLAIDEFNNDESWAIFQFLDDDAWFRFDWILDESGDAVALCINMNGEDDRADLISRDAPDASDPEAGCYGDEWENYVRGQGRIAIKGYWKDAWDTTHLIESDEWEMGESNFHIVEYDNAGEFAIAENDENNEWNPSLWSRFDWTMSEGSIYYCQTTYDAATEEDARNTDAADASDLDEGCGGFAWSKLDEYGS